MKKGNAVAEKSYAFAIRIVNCYKYLCSEKKEFVLSKQLLKSGTSIGANVEEALGGHSRKEFSAKLSIAYKEARETNFWLRILRDTRFIDDKMCNSLLADNEELLKLIGSIAKTLKHPPLIRNS
jgi:four helix bundle protein